MIKVKVWHMFGTVICVPVSMTGFVWLVLTCGRFGMLRVFLAATNCYIRFLSFFCQT